MSDAEMNYRIPVTITDVFERKEKRHVTGIGPEAVFSTGSAGWYIQLSNQISLYVGTERPTMQIGDKLFIKLEGLDASSR